VAYRLGDEEELSAGIRRCGFDELDGAVEQLSTRVAEEPIDAVHEARKSLKKTRALVRLVRPALGDRAYRRESETLRDAGRRLSGVRDAEVAVQTLDSLSERYAGQLPASAFARLREALVAERQAARGKALPAGALRQIILVLEGARERAAEWPLAGEGWSLVGPGLRRSYARGRRALRSVEGEPSVENLHEWRKRVKDLWYHERVLRTLWPPVMSEQADQLHVLSELLGDDHDLAVLRRKLESDPHLYAAVPADLDPLLELIDGRRDQLLARARLLGGRVYAERPKAFHRRLRAYWRAHTAERAAPDLVWS